jgi:hypothetical protein
VTPVPVFINHFLGVHISSVRMPGMHKHRAHPVTADTREWGGKITGPRSQEGREAKAEQRGFGTKKPQTLRGLVASCSHLCIKHGHRAVGGHSKDGSPEQPANWRMCLSKEGSS